MSAIRPEHRRAARAVWNASLDGAGEPDPERLHQALYSLMLARGRACEPVLKAILARARLYVNERSIRVSSESPMPERRRAALLDAIAASGFRVQSAVFDADPDLIAGVRLRIGHRVIDTTIKRQLEILEAALLRS